MPPITGSVSKYRMYRLNFLLTLNFNTYVQTLVVYKVPSWSSLESWPKMYCAISLVTQTLFSLKTKHFYGCTNAKWGINCFSNGFLWSSKNWLVIKSQRNGWKSENIVNNLLAKWQVGKWSILESDNIFIFLES